MKIKIMTCSWNSSLVNKTLDVQKVSSKLTLEKLALKVDQLALKVDQLTEIVRKGFTTLTQRIDNLVIKNNLIE